MVGLNIRGSTRRCFAASTTRSQVGLGILVSGVCGVEPEHVGVVIVPKRHDEYHTLSESLGHVRLSTLVFVGVCVLEGCLLLIAELGCDGVTVDTGNRGSGLRNGLSALDIEALDLHSVTSANELSNDSELLRGVHSHALAVEILDTHTVAVEVTAVRIAYASIAVCRVCSTTAVTVAAGLLDGAARMGCDGRTDGVGFPDVHLSAARAVATDTSICISGRRLPTFDVTLVSELVIETTK
jgi:hypothetical protein